MSAPPPTYTTPFATAGEERTSFPAWNDHRFAAVDASRAYTLLSYDPTYTTPFTTAGEEWTHCPVRNDHHLAIGRVWVDRTFLWGFSPWWYGPPRNCDQFVLTRNG